MHASGVGSIYPSKYWDCDTSLPLPDRRRSSRIKWSSLHLQLPAGSRVARQRSSGCGVLDLMIMCCCGVLGPMCRRADAFIPEVKPRRCRHQRKRNETNETCAHLPRGGEHRGRVAHPSTSGCGRASTTGHRQRCWQWRLRPHHRPGVAMLASLALSFRHIPWPASKFAVPFDNITPLWPPLVPHVATSVRQQRSCDVPEGRRHPI